MGADWRAVEDGLLTSPGHLAGEAEVLGDRLAGVPALGDKNGDQDDVLRLYVLYDLVEVGFLDQDPKIGDVVENVEAENIVLIPVFIAEGWHTRETIPEDLGLTGEVTVRATSSGHKTIFYGAPVGTHPSMADLIAARARETEVVRNVS